MRIAVTCTMAPPQAICNTAPKLRPPCFSRERCGFAPASTVQILRGENAGRSVTYTNVVRVIDKLGDWIGKTATFDMPGVARDGDGFVVLVQKDTPERPGAILAAANTKGL
jgi:hypothetical protein